MAVSQITFPLENPQIGNKFDYYTTSTDLPKYQDILDFTNSSGDKYIDCKFAELVDQVAYTNLISNAYLTSIKHC